MSRQLYDLDVDPGERYDRSAEHPEIVERLDRRMQDLATNLPPEQ